MGKAIGEREIEKRERENERMRERETWTQIEAWKDPAQKVGQREGGQGCGEKEIGGKRKQRLTQASEESGK